MATDAVAAGHASGILGLLGGTFDPIHYGHLRFADEVQRSLGLIELRLVPAGNPAHRGGPRASAGDRLEMVRLGAAEFPGLRIDEREVRRGTPSYTVLTLEDIRSEEGDRPVSWLTGADSFCGLPAWYRWEELFTLTDFIVTTRPSYDLEAALPAALRPWWQRARIDDAALLARPGRGRILVHPVSPQAIAASEIRRRLGAGESVAGLLPPSVLDYIGRHHLYQSPDAPQ